MYWPKDSHVKAIGFTRDVLPFVKYALIHSQIEWENTECDPGTKYDRFEDKFSWANCDWILISTDYVIIELILISDISQELTMLMLQGKVAKTAT